MSRKISVDSGVHLVLPDSGHHQLRHGGGGGIWVGAHHDVGQVVHAEGVQHAEEDRHHDATFGERQSDAGKALPGVGAVHAGRLVEFLGDHL